jgi:Tfp pilus assembly protein PilF
LRSLDDPWLEAIDVDPDYAQAHAELGWGYYNLCSHGFGCEQPRVQARAAAQRALDLEPAIGSANNMLGYMAMSAGDWAQATTRYETALAAEPGHGPLRTGYGWALLSQGRLEEAALNMERGLAADPLFGNAHWAMGNVHTAARNHPAAVASFERGAELGETLASSIRPSRIT